MGCHAHLQGIFLTQGSLLHWRADSLPLSHLFTLLVKLSSVIWSRLYFPVLFTVKVFTNFIIEKQYLEKNSEWFDIGHTAKWSPDEIQLLKPYKVNTILLTVFSYIPSPTLTYFTTESLYLLIMFTYFMPHPQIPLPSGNCQPAENRLVVLNNYLFNGFSFD